MDEDPVRYGFLARSIACVFSPLLPRLSCKSPVEFDFVKRDSGKMLKPEAMRL